MDAQTLLALLLVVAALAYLGRRTWRTLRATRKAAGEGCGTGCGCESGGSGAARHH